MANKRFNPNSVSDEELLNELKRLAKKLGKTPSRNDMMKGTEMTKRLYLYGKRFGGLTQACEKVGLKPNIGGKGLKYTEKELLDHILYIEKEIGRTPTQEDIGKFNNYAIGAYKRHFGTYNNALEKLNLKHNVKYNVSKEDIIQSIIDISKVIGRSPTSREFSERGNVSSVTACKKLGTHSWNKVLKLCGLPIAYNKNLTKQELKDELVKLEKELGRIPGYYDMTQIGKYSAETYSNHFGSYIAALKYFGYNYVPQSQWNNQEHTKGLDGTLYKSKFEANIGNILYQLKKSNKIDNYEYEKQVCADRKWTCDFYVQKDGHNFWVEADGMGKHRNVSYDDDNEKIKYYKDNNYDFRIISYRKTLLNMEIEKMLKTKQKTKTLDDCLKTYKTSWDDSVPLKFPKTKNISNKINAPPSEKLIWKGHELTRDFFSQCTPNERDEIAKDIFNYLMECDLTNYRVPIEEVKKDLKQLRQKTLKTEVKDGKTYLPNIVSTGNKAYRYFFPNLMKLKNGKKASVYDCLNDPKILWKIIRNRVGNTMLYSHDDSTPRQYPFTLTTLNMFIQGAKSTGYASHGSQFKPLLAKAIYDAHVKDGDNVLDYSAGYGARLLGLWATGKKCRYYAYEPCTETYNGLVALAKYLGFPVKLKKSGSEDSVFNAKMDFIFSSPPYYDVEHYTDEPSQSANKFPKYDDFLEGYWRETVKNIKKMMKPDAIFAINVGNGANKKMIQLTHDFKRIIEEEGFSLVNEWVMKTSKSHLSGKRGKSKVIKEEGIYFYRLS